MHVHVNASTHGGKKCKIPLEFQLQEIVGT